MKHSVNATNLVNVSKRLAFAAALMTGVAVAPVSSAMAQAAITWGSPTDENGTVSQVFTSGSSFNGFTASSQFDSAVTNTSGATVGTVNFKALASQSSTQDTFSGSGITLNNADNTANGGLNAAGALGTAPSGWDSGYKNLVASGAQALDGAYAGSLTTIVVTGLTPGQTYLMQIFENVWDLNWKTTFSDGLGDAVTLNLSGPSANGYGGSDVPQFVDGSFTASGSSETLTLTSGPGWITFGAIQVLNTQSSTAPVIPEPGTLPLMAVGLVGLAALAGRKIARK